MRVLALMLFAAAFGMAQVRIYVADGRESKITVIDPQTNKVSGEIAVSPGPHALAASPEGHWLYVLSWAKSMLDVVDVRTAKRTRGIATEPGPDDLVVAPDTRHVFVCTDASFEVIDTASLGKVHSIFGMKAPCRIYLTPDETRLIVASLNAPWLRLVNIRSMEPEFSFDIHSSIKAIAIEGDRNHVIHRIFAALTGEIEVIDYASRKVMGHISLAARDLAISPDWKTLWATVGDSVEVYSLADLKRTATIPVGNTANGIVFTPDGKRCFVANFGDNSVSSIDTATNKELTRIPVGDAPIRLVASEWMP